MLLVAKKCVALQHRDLCFDESESAVERHCADVDKLVEAFRSPVLSYHTLVYFNL